FPFLLMLTAPQHPSSVCPVIVFIVAISCLASVRADDTSAAKQIKWLTGENVNLGGILFPDFHFTSSYGGATINQERLAVSHHDPQRDGWTVQGFEFGTSLRAGDYLEGFGTFLLAYNGNERVWEHEFEEWFGKIKNLPFGLELRGGQYLNRFGFQNSIHNHAWNFADQYLVNGLILGEDGLTTIGGELTWKLPVNWTSLISVSVGVPREEEEHHHEDSAAEPEFEAGGAQFDSTFVVANWTNNFDYNDFHQFRGGLSGAWGDNKWGLNTQIYGAHFEYQWRQNGYEPGGRYFRWRTEAMLRDFGAISGHLPSEEPEAEEVDHNKETPRQTNLNQFGIYSAFTYGLDNGLEFCLRGDYVSGIAAAGLDERFRLSPSITYYLNKNRSMYLRTQYNYDQGSDFGHANSVWAQVGINWGGPEVR
ncbi:MAG: hypothetical protein K8R87_11945, partial [Verrucomicrobia bacterium]|nr:hypothetical protein [Verrucomicrobiota bacterium]